MRTVSFFGEEKFSAAGLDAEGSSSAIRIRWNFYLTLPHCQTFAPNFPSKPSPAHKKGQIGSFLDPICLQIRLLGFSRATRSG